MSKIVNAFVKMKISFKQWMNRRPLKNRDFTIFCNNCCAGFIYKHFGLAYRTPTMWLGVRKFDFIKLVRNTRHYMTYPICIINDPNDKGYDTNLSYDIDVNYPVGRVDDILIHFTHYRSPKTARQTWRYLCKQVNYDNILYLYAENELLTEELRRAFLNSECIGTKLLIHQTTRFMDNFDSNQEVFIDGISNDNELREWHQEDMMKNFDWIKFLNSIKNS